MPKHSVEITEGLKSQVEALQGKLGEIEMILKKYWGTETIFAPIPDNVSNETVLTRAVYMEKYTQAMVLLSELYAKTWDVIRAGINGTADSDFLGDLKKDVQELSKLLMVFVVTHQHALRVHKDNDKKVKPGEQYITFKISEDSKDYQTLVQKLPEITW